MTKKNLTCRGAQGTQTQECMLELGSKGKAEIKQAQRKG